MDNNGKVTSVALISLGRLKSLKRLILTHNSLETLDTRTMAKLPELTDLQVIAIVLSVILSRLIWPMHMPTTKVCASLSGLSFLRDIY